MSDAARISAALARWEAAGRDLSSAVDHLSLDGRRALITLRTEMGARFAELGSAIDTAIARRSDPLLVEARRRCAALRRAVGNHQARWPTVVISDDVEAYAADSRVLRAERDAFAAWLRDALAHIS